jgi:DNA-binding NarL/FixJ family response regulator
MHAWPLPPSPLASTASPLQRSLGGVIQAIGRPRFAAQALQDLNAVVSAGSWAVYQRFADRAPVLHLSASHGVADSTQDCFAAYRDAGLYRRDGSLAAVPAPPGSAVLLRMHAGEAPNAEHREAIYRRHGLLERLSVASRCADGSVLAVNLYHHAHQGSFSDGELAHFGELAPALLASVTRHLELSAASPATADAATSTRARLVARCPALTARELDVLERLLQGLSYDGIAADLGLSLATVKTYRARAFDRLGLHFKSELFAALLPVV